jgi:hypothetical protein
MAAIAKARGEEMNLAKLMKTPSAKAARKQLGDTDYLQWLTRAIDADVSVFKQNEFPEKSWAICVHSTDYWLEAVKTKREALKMCDEMEWRVVE